MKLKGIEIRLNHPIFRHFNPEIFRFLEKLHNNRQLTPFGIFFEFI
jgi:hypothetical protein